MKLPKIYMVLPAYNEEKNLPDLLSSLELTFGILSRLGYEREYVIVDDGSKDGTPVIIREWQQQLPITVITHDPNQGLGITMRDGLGRASELADKDDVIFAMDADNTHPAGLMVPMAQKIIEGNDVVIASRYRPGAGVVGVSWLRKLMSTGVRVLFQLVFPIQGVRDYSCGYRAYRARVLQEAFDRYGESFIEYRGFHCMVDILLKLSRMKVIMNEVPMILRYDLKGGESKMRVGTTVFNTLKLLVRRRFVG